ncbi:MAG: acyltransferase domain-containing protein, partial [Blastocatellia bacterium]
MVCRDVADAISACKGHAPGRVTDGARETNDRSVVFLFPGQGAQYTGMGRELYNSEPVFKQELDRCSEILAGNTGLNLKSVLYPDSDSSETTMTLSQTVAAQPALFSIEYAMARTWMAWGVKPCAMIGHSLGEFVAACISGVLDLDDALKLVAARGRMMQELPAGAMISVVLAEDEARLLASSKVSIAAINAPSQCVLSGPVHAILETERILAGEGVTFKRLETSRAFHSAMMDGIVGPLTEIVRGLRPRSPEIPYISNVTGTWATAEEVRQPEYWARHARCTVRFDLGLRELLSDRDRTFLEVGPGTTLKRIVRKQGELGVSASVFSSSERKSDFTDRESMLDALGGLWLAGARTDWNCGREGGRRVELPTYPFERKRYWIEPAGNSRARLSRTVDEKRTSGDWFYMPSWSMTPRPLRSTRRQRLKATWMILEDEGGVGSCLVQ